MEIGTDVFYQSKMNWPQKSLKYMILVSLNVMIKSSLVGVNILSFLDRIIRHFGLKMIEDKTITSIIYFIQNEQ